MRSVPRFECRTRRHKFNATRKAIVVESNSNFDARFADHYDVAKLESRTCSDSLARRNISRETIFYTFYRALMYNFQGIAKSTSALSCRLSFLRYEISATGRYFFFFNSNFAEKLGIVFARAVKINIKSGSLSRCFPLTSVSAPPCRASAAQGRYAGCRARVSLSGGISSSCPLSAAATPCSSCSIPKIVE